MKGTCRRRVVTVENLDEIGAPNGHVYIISKQGNITTVFASI
jgi:hypothetical protein